MKRNCPSHPKVYDLCERLNAPRPLVLGYLELLWHFTAQYAPQGDIGRFANKRIEAAMDWDGENGELIKAMILSGWIDESVPTRLVVHDWKDHADQAVMKRLSRSGLQMYGSEKQAEFDIDDPPFNTLTPPSPVPTPTMDAKAIEEVAARIHARHPAIRRCGIGEVKRLLRAITNKLPRGERVVKLQTIDANHASWCASEQWTKDNGTFASGLANWLAPTVGRYESAAPSTVTVTSRPKEVTVEW